LSSASENDLTVFKRECVPAIAGKTIFADKIYRDNPYWDNEREVKNNELLTPVKAAKGQLRKRNRGIRLLMTFILLPSNLSESPWKPFTAGLSIKQIFKELKSAGLLPDCLYIRLANLPSRSFS